MNTHTGYRIFCLLISLTLMLVPTTGNVTAQSEMDLAAIDAYVATQQANLGIPGMALGIVQDDQIVHLQGFGVADSSGRAVTPQTPFFIGSVTKSFTALAVMQLVEAGKIDLDAPVQQYLPWFELADKEASARITVRHLLNHTTGLSTVDGNYDLYSPQGLEEMVRGLSDVSLTKPVGTTYQYCNLNYGIAGLIVETVSGQSYADYVTQHIFEPLDIQHSYASLAPAQADGLSDGHHFMFGRAFKRDREIPPAKLPEGFLITSAEDLSHYAIAQLNDGRYGDISILSPDGIAELHAPAIPTNLGDEHYAMGWAVRTLDGVPLISHTGDMGQFVTVVVLMPEIGSGFVLLANASGFVQTIQVVQIARGVINLINGDSAPAVSAPFGRRFLYWAILLAPFLMILGIAYSWRHWQNKGIIHILLIVLVYGGVALLWLLVVPRLMETPLSSVFNIQSNHPDLAIGLTAGAALGIGWSIIYTVMNLIKRRSK